MLVSACEAALPVAVDDVGVGRFGGFVPDLGTVTATTGFGSPMGLGWAEGSALLMSAIMASKFDAVSAVLLAFASFAGGVMAFLFFCDSKFTKRGSLATSICW